jgi:hypothetical protein
LNSIKSIFIILSSLLIFSCEKKPTPPIIPETGTGTLTGTILNENYQFPVAGAHINTLNSQAADTTDDEGNFQLEYLNFGTHTLTITAPYYDSLSTEIMINDTLQNVILNLPVDSDLSCFPVEDTNRVYHMPYDDNVYKVYPKSLFARFYPWVTDTSYIGPVLEKYNLSALYYFRMDQQWVAYICILDDSRPECHFTPYGKVGINNFGADSLVEFSFGIFSDGYILFEGNLRFLFNENTSQATIDSLFESNGLRFLYTRPHSSGENAWYVTLITPAASKNVVDLGIDLQYVPFVKDIWIHRATIMYPNWCD